MEHFICQGALHYLLSLPFSSAGIAGIPEVPTCTMKTIYTWTYLIIYSPSLCLSLSLLLSFSEKRSYRSPLHDSSTHFYYCGSSRPPNLSRSILILLLLRAFTLVTHFLLLWTVLCGQCKDLHFDLFTICSYFDLFRRVWSSRV